jgi:hypothetical protein
MLVKLTGLVKYQLPILLVRFTQRVRFCAVSTTFFKTIETSIGYMLAEEGSSIIRAATKSSIHCVWLELVAR